MKIRFLFLLLLGSILPVLTLGAEGVDATAVSGGGKNIQGKTGNPHPAQSTNEYPPRGAKQTWKENKKTQAGEDICLYGPRDLPSVMVQAARATAR
jgi:hypothetical protein